MANSQRREGHKRNIFGDIFFPADEFNPLIKKCLDCNLKNSYIDDLLFSRLFSSYGQFLNMTNKGYTVIGKTYREEENPPMLERRESLRPIKDYLERTSRKYFIIGLETGSDVFETLLNLSYSKEKIAEFKKRGVRNKNLLEGIFDFAIAYYYWCLSSVADGRRIGIVNSIKNNQPVIDKRFYKERIPDIHGDFYEFDMMQRLIPSYNRMKAFSFSERDFLINASDEEVGNRLVEILSDFKQECNKENNPYVLAKMAKQIKEYGIKLEWDPSEFFKNARLK